MLTASLEPQTSLYREHLSLLPDPVTLANYTRAASPPIRSPAPISRAIS